MTATLKKAFPCLMAFITLISSWFGFLFPQITVMTDLSYGAAGAQKIDLYLPKTKATGCTAIVVYIHGGAWSGGDKGEYAGQCETQAKKGYAAVSVNYRMLGEGATWQDMLDDITAALALAETTAAANGIILEKAGFTGGSAGAHLAMLYAFKNQAVSPVEVAFCASQCGPSDFNDIRFFEDCYDPAWAYTIVSGLIGRPFDKNTFGDVTAELQAASPVFYITKDSPPTIVAQGEKDQVVRYSQGLDVYDAFYASGAQCDLILYPNSDHGLNSDPDCTAKYKELFKEYELKYFGY